MYKERHCSGSRKRKAVAIRNFLKGGNIIIRVIFILWLYFLVAGMSAPVFAQTEVVADDVSVEKEEDLRERLGKEKEKPPEIIIKEPVEAEKVTPPFFAEKVLIKKISLIGATFLSQEEINGIILPYENKELSLIEMQKVTDLITDAYHKKGYITSGAYITQIKTEQGILEIRVIEGITGEIKIEGNRYFKTSLLKKKITLKKGGPFNNNILEKDLQKINKHPDRKVRAVVKPGREPGVTDITLEVKDNLPLHINYGWENYLGRYFSDNRYSNAFVHNNLTGRDDILKIEGKFAEEHTQELVAINYTVPLSENLEIGFQANHKDDDFVEEFKDLGLEKRTRKYAAFVNRYLVKQADCESSVNLGFSYIDAFSYVLGNKTSQDRLRVLNMGFDLNRSDKFGRTIVIQDTGFGIPNIMGGLSAKDNRASRRGAGGKFIKTNLTLARQHKLISDFSLLFKSQFQFSSRVLTTLTAEDKFRLGGISNVRGYPPSEAEGDNGYVLTLGCGFPPYFVPKGLRVPFSKAKLYDALRLLIFYDWANAHLRNPGAGEEKSRTLRSVGCGLRMNLPEAFSLRVDIGWPLDKHPTDHTRHQTWFSVSKGFHF